MTTGRRWRMALFGLVATGVWAGAMTSGSAEPLPISQDPAAAARAEQLAAQIRASGVKSFQRTKNPAAQWFPQAGFGLFMHWGIHSVVGAQPSWAMIKDYPYGYRPDLYPPEKYWALAQRFDPQNYDPDKWFEAAKQAGFKYAVLTTKHHDGYCLWPTAYGDMNTRVYMHGRDLLKPYVEACRRHGLKVGFYFSPPDWHYPGYPTMIDFDNNKRDQRREIKDPAQNQRNFERYYAYTIGQLYELLTRYGKIDLLWFDGMGWEGIKDFHTPETLAWIRSLQPGIVINNRWGGTGDYKTTEWNMPDQAPEGWWENCIAWNGHWGYNPKGKFQTAAWVLDRLARCRAGGGNFLLNVGPAPDGTMPPGFYERCAELKQWVAHSGQAVSDVSPVRTWHTFSPVPITRRAKLWYVHILPEQQGPVTLRHTPPPVTAKLLRTGEKVQCQPQGDDLVITVPDNERTALDDVVILQWTHEPSL